MLEDMVHILINLDLSAPQGQSLGVIQGAQNPIDDQSLGCHSRHVNPQGIPAIFQLVCHTFLSITFASSKISGGA